MFNPSRDQARNFLFHAWQKHGEKLPLEPLESKAVDIIVEHPEYQPMLADPERNKDRDYPPEAGETNPFLHLSMHLALYEQISIDQPAGVAAAFQALTKRHGDTHAALHEMMDCLAETLWQAQRNHTPPSNSQYLSLLQQRIVGKR